MDEFGKNVHVVIYDDYVSNINGCIKRVFDFLKNYDYNIGCRIHGCMASFAAGIPSFLFVTDRRTQEFADCLQDPRRRQAYSHWLQANPLSYYL